MFTHLVGRRAREVWPVSEEYGWVLGRIEDPTVAVREHMLSPRLIVRGSSVRVP